jgi:hypothetical protein
MPEAVIVSTARTPIGKAYRGAFNTTHGMDRVTYQDPPEDASWSRRLRDERRVHVGRPQATRNIVSDGTGEPLLKLERE